MDRDTVRHGIVRTGPQVNEGWACGHCKGSREGLLSRSIREEKAGRSHRRSAYAAQSSRNVK